MGLESSLSPLNQGMNSGHSPDATLSTSGNPDTEKQILEPPGGILIWLLVLLELFTFGIAILFYLHERNNSTPEFRHYAGFLNINLGTINTVILLSSGYFMAACITSLRSGNIKTGSVFLRLTLFTGIIFIVIKCYEYMHLLEQGLGLGSHLFMDFYWLLTGFHLIHLLCGLVILLWIYIAGKSKKQDRVTADFETGGVFWHLCDLIWLMVFPVLYLLH